MKPLTDDALAAFGVEIGHYFADEQYCKVSRIAKGCSLTMHTHSYDHLSVLVAGTVCVEVDGMPSIYTGFKTMNIEAGKEHKVTAMTDAIWLCIHETDDTNPETVDISLMSKVVDGK